jgi:predicted TIM-barrel fold metal-dependent hydrolase
LLVGHDEVEVIDAQVHVWERDSIERPWDRVAAQAYRDLAGDHLWSFTSREVTAEDMLIAMREAGVDAAVAVSPFLIYGYDASYAFDAASAYPDHFGVVSAFNPQLRELERELREWQSRPGALGLRLVLSGSNEVGRLAGGIYDPLLRATEREAIPICIYMPGSLRLIHNLAKSYPNLQFVLDHLGMPAAGDPTWAGLPDLLRLAVYPNIAVKATAVPVHSREGYPFRDVWQTLDQIIDRFGIDRVMWGSDWTRVRGVTYAEGLRFITENTLLSLSDKRKLLGENLRRIFDWDRHPRQAVAHTD